MPGYSSSFYRSETFYAITSAVEVVPHLMHMIAPKSVADVGCGSGGWLAVFQQHGVDDVLGYDGDWVDRRLLRISPAQFSAHDLRQPLDAGRTFDLALCLEVGEHLPESSAAQLVDTLTSLAPVVLFSAAIPHQGGTGHINEQWQSWWAVHFADRGYVPVDCLRYRIWNHPGVSHWYCQNMLVYVERSHLARLPLLAAEIEPLSASMLDVVHPRMFVLAETSFPRLAKRALTMAPRAIRQLVSPRSSRREDAYAQMTDDAAIEALLADRPAAS